MGKSVAMSLATVKKKQKLKPRVHSWDQGLLAVVYDEHRGTYQIARTAGQQRPSQIRSRVLLPKRRFLLPKCWSSKAASSSFRNRFILSNMETPRACV